MGIVGNKNPLFILQEKLGSLIFWICLLFYIVTHYSSLKIQLPFDIVCVGESTHHFLRYFIMMVRSLSLHNIFIFQLLKYLLAVKNSVMRYKALLRLHFELQRII